MANKNKEKPEYDRKKVEAEIADIAKREEARQKAEIAKW